MKDLIRLAEVNAYAVFDTVLCGTQTPHGRELYKWLSNPVVGGLVLECSTFFFHPGPVDGNRLGRLLRVGYETVEDGDEEWQPEPERTWYLETLDGREFRWHNARFIRVLERPLSYEELVAENRDKPVNARLWGSGLFAGVMPPREQSEHRK